MIVSAGTALGTWFVLWYLADVLSGRAISERITVERHAGSAIRLAGLLTGNGIVLGAAAAGDWTPGKFLHDFSISAWPALGLTAVAVLMDRMSASRSSAGRSAWIGSGYLVIAALWAIYRGHAA